MAEHKSGHRPHRAFILAAGLGTRMRPYTDHYPKPMVKVADRSLISRTLDHLLAAGVDEVVVNLHYLADVLRAHLDAYLDTVRGQGKKLVLHYSYEEPILDTAGGIKKVLPIFQDDLFYVIAGDSLWEDGKTISALDRLAQHWDDRTMDILTLMQPLEKMVLTQGVGDFDLYPDGRVRRSKDKTGAYMWTNIRLNHPRIYRDAPEGAFSFLKIMDACEEKNRFHALVHDGEWYHISTPADLETVDREYRRTGK